MKRTKPPSADSPKPSGASAGSTEPTIRSQSGARGGESGVSKDRAIPPILLEGDEPKEATLAGPGQKFASSYETDAAEENALGDELPEAYGTGHLFLTARDPGCLYAHWDLTKEQQQRHIDASSDNHILLRVHQESIEGPLVAELRIHPGSHHSFVNISVPNARYIADLGYFETGAGWKSVAKSNTATPPAAPTIQEQSVTPVRFATLNFPTVAPAKAELRETASPVSELRIDQPTLDCGAMAGFPLPPTSPRFQVPGQIVEFSASPLPEPPIYSTPSVQTAGAATHKEPVEEEPVEEQSGRSSTGTGPFPISETQWTPAKERALAQIIGLSLIQQKWLSSQEIEELIRGEFRGGIFPEGEISSIQAALGQAAISSAAMLERVVAERGFWFNVNAELVIYGATEANATVTIAGRPIRLRPDGTFSYRFALPDGLYQLPIRAVSSDGEMRQAELEFHRATVYFGDVRPHPQDPNLKPPSAENVS
jgi:hypothetical protein